MRLGLLTVLAIIILRWPDWQLTTLFTRGFRIGGTVEPSNISPDPKASTGSTTSESDLLDVVQADKWKCTLDADLRPSDFDEELFEKAVEQSKQGLLSYLMTKSEMDKHFGGTGTWRGLRRRGGRNGTLLLRKISAV